MGGEEKVAEKEGMERWRERRVGVSVEGLLDEEVHDAPLDLDRLHPLVGRVERAGGGGVRGAGAGAEELGVVGDVVLGAVEVEEVRGVDDGDDGRELRRVKGRVPLGDGALELAAHVARLRDAAQLDEDPAPPASVVRGLLAIVESRGGHKKWLHGQGEQRHLAGPNRSKR